MSDHDKIVDSLKAAAWERAKGELRSIVALEGSKHGGIAEADGRYKYLHISDMVEDFVERFESQEYQF